MENAYRIYRKMWKVFHHIHQTTFKIHYIIRVISIRLSILLDDTNLNVFFYLFFI